MGYDQDTSSRFRGCRALGRAVESGRIRVDRKAPTQKIKSTGKIATRAAVEEGIVAGGVVALLVTTEVMIAEVPKKDAAGGGMDGMDSV